MCFVASLCPIVTKLLKKGGRGGCVRLTLIHETKPVNGENNWHGGAHIEEKAFWQALQAQQQALRGGRLALRGERETVRGG